ncbi:hypothetical protein Tco_1439113 [Tanacetum coccineum]
MIKISRVEYQHYKKPSDGTTAKAVSNKGIALIQGQPVSRWHVSDFALGVKVVFMLQVDIRTSYVSCQCTSSDGDSAAPCLLRRLATPDWLTLAS